MGLLEFILLCVIVGLIVYLVNTLLPIPGPIKTIIMVAAVLVLIVILIRGMGLDLSMPRLR
jgi:hypothetical protein